MGKDAITVGTPTRARVSHGPDEGKSKDNCDMRESKIAGEGKPRDEGKSIHRTPVVKGHHHLSKGAVRMSVGIGHLLLVAMVARLLAVYFRHLSIAHPCTVCHDRLDMMYYVLTVVYAGG